MPALAMMTDVTFGQSLLLSAVGTIIVFAALCVIILMIKLISLVSNITAKRIAPIADEKLVAAPVPAVQINGKVPATGSLGEIALHDTDERSAAMIMAIIADELKKPLNELRFISIKAV